MKNNKRTYLIIIICGVILTLSLIATIWTKNEIDVIFNILAMLGSGIFCSAIVSYFLDKRQELINLQKQLDSQRFLYSDLINEISFLMSREIKYLSIYSNDVIECQETKKSLSLYEATHLIQKLLETARKSIAIGTLSINNTQTSDFLRNITFDNYKIVQKKLSNILSNGCFYLKSGVLNEKSLSNLKDIETNITLIILCLHENDLSVIINKKLDFFKKVLIVCNEIINVNAVAVSIID